MAPLSRRAASLGDSDLEAPLNPSSVKHNSVSAHGSTVRDGETQKWHDGIAGGVVSLYSVMAYTLLTVTTFTISLPTCRQAITSLGSTLPLPLPLTPTLTLTRPSPRWAAPHASRVR